MPVTVKGMAASMLAHLGDPAANHGALWAMNYRLIRLMLDCRVELVILDDFHHLIDRGNQPAWSKSRIGSRCSLGKTGIPFLVVGIDGKVERILEANAQLCLPVCRAPDPGALPARPEDAASVQEFGGSRSTPNKPSRCLCQPPCPGWSLSSVLGYEVTQGVVANLMNLLRYAAWLTQQQPQATQTAVTPPTIALTTLAAAYDKRMAKHLKRPANPLGRSPRPYLISSRVLLAVTPPARRRARRSASQPPPTAAVQPEATHDDVTLQFPCSAAPRCCPANRCRHYGAPGRTQSLWRNRGLDLALPDAAGAADEPGQARLPVLWVNLSAPGALVSLPQPEPWAAQRGLLHADAGAIRRGASRTARSMRPTSPTYCPR